MQRSLFVAGALLLALAGTASAESERLVTVVTSAEPQTQLMAMVLTMQAVQQGTDVHMLLCGPGGDLGLREPPATATAPQPPRDMSPQGLMQAIIAQGGRVEVCAIYLPGRGAGLEVLLDGVGVASPPDMAAAMLAEAARVWSF
jgi:predicted peroxiredoxin